VVKHGALQLGDLRREIGLSGVAALDIGERLRDLLVLLLGVLDDFTVDLPDGRVEQLLLGLGVDLQLLGDLVEQALPSLGVAR